MQPTRRSLDYGDFEKHATRVQHKKFISLFTVGAVTIVLILVGFRALSQVRLLTTQSKCMNYSAKSDAVVLAAGNVSVQLLPAPACWNSLLEQLHLSAPGISNSPLVFLHSRQMPHDSQDYLLAVQAYSIPGGTKSRNLVAFYMDVFKPGTFNSPCEKLNGFGDTLNMGYQNYLVAHPGKIDPTDSTHFTINLDIDGTPVVVDGWLRGPRWGVLEMRSSTSPPPTSSRAKSP